LNLLDLAAIAALTVAGVIGAGRGFFVPVLGLAGGLAGLGAGLLLAGPLAAALAPLEQPIRGLLALIVVAFLVIGGEGLGGTLGATASRTVPARVRRPLDRIGGALVGVLHGVFFIWLVGGLLAAGVVPGLARAAHESVVLRQTYELLPPPGAVAGRLLALFEASDLPRLFGGLEPPAAPPVELPDDAQARQLAASAIPSTVRVISLACGFQLIGSGFFISPTQAVTNAHVVAGSSETTVTLGEATFVASVVLFDADADIALLNVVGVEAPALALSTELPARGQVAVALGFPGGGALTAQPAGVTATYDAVGPDIYGEDGVSRSIVEIQAEIQQGNSGGPLVTAPGTVGGVVFGASRADPEVGYAIPAPDAAARLALGLGRTEPTDTGRCR
jgi:S1-C subfamily serine protease